MEKLNSLPTLHEIIREQDDVQDIINPDVLQEQVTSKNQKHPPVTAPASKQVSTPSYPVIDLHENTVLKSAYQQALLQHFQNQIEEGK